MNVTEEIKDVDGNVVRRRVLTICEGPSRTKQSMKDECDINRIMAKYEKTGLITHNAKRQAYFDDVTEVPDFAAAIDTVRKAEEMFMTLPAKVRIKFNNDPVAYVSFCSDPKNLDQMIELGLAPKPEVVAPVEVIVTNPVTPAPTGGA